MNTPSRRTSPTTEPGRWKRSLRTRSAILLMAGAMVALAACGGATGSSGAGADSSEKPLIYGVYATPLEEPWDGAIHTALTKAAKDGEIRYKYVDQLSTADAMTRALRDIATNEKPDAIMGDAFSAEDAVRQVAADFPKIPFTFGSGEKPASPNLNVFDNWIQDSAYLAGMLSGGLTKSGTIGVVGAMPIPEVDRIINAYIAGVAQVNPQAKVKVSFINSFFDPAAAKNAAEAQISAGADVLFAERDGVIAAAKDANIPVIGMMVDQKSEAPRNVATSLVWNVGPTVDAVIKEIKSGPEAADYGEYSFMKNGGNKLAPLNRDIPGGIPDTLIAKIETKQKAIMDGDFVTPIDETAPRGSVDVSKTK